MNTIQSRKEMTHEFVPTDVRQIDFVANAVDLNHPQQTRENVYARCAKKNERNALQAADSAPMLATSVKPSCQKQNDNCYYRGYPLWQWYSS